MFHRLSFVWGVALLIGSVALLWLGNVRMGGHWAFHGSGLDHWLHRERFWVVPLLCAPLILSTLVLLARQWEIAFTAMVVLLSLDVMALWWLVFFALE